MKDLTKMAAAELIRELAKTTNDGYDISEAHKRVRIELIVNLLHQNTIAPINALSGKDWIVLD